MKEIYIFFQMIIKNSLRLIFEPAVTVSPTHSLKVRLEIVFTIGGKRNPYMASPEACTAILMKPL